MDRIPTFHGYTTESIRDFWADLVSYFKAKDIPATRQQGIIEAQIRGPARHAYDADLADPASALAIAIAAAVGAGGGAAAVAAATVEAIRVWLMERYFGDEAKDRIKEQLTNLRINTKESPFDFHTRVQHYMQLAEETNPSLEEIIFLQGLPQDIREHKIRMAQAYWTTKNSDYSLSQELPKALYDKLYPKEPVVTIVSPPVSRNEGRVPEFIPGAPTASVQAAAKGTVTEEAMNELTKKFAQMTAHVAEIQGIRN